MLFNEPHPLEVKVLTKRFEYPQKDPIWIDEFWPRKAMRGSGKRWR